MSPFILLTGIIIITRDVTGWLCCSLVGWYDLLPTRCLHASPLTISLHVVTVYVMCVCREYVGSEANDEGGGKEEEGRAKRL